ncbi:MAG TPA: serine/threonine protein kinase [Cyanobacteria bacterium UBA11372]|nr:serine/threonine protein kinase [Cyanobacteria bacterium UBA11372]
MVWAEGQQLHSGKFLIERVLGRGGFGITYKARHTMLEQYFVIKTPDEYLSIDPEYPKYIDRFINEAKILAKLSTDPHPHIVRVTDFFKEGNIYCLVMDYIEGESLSHLVQRQGALPETEAIEYICQIGDALSVVHKANLVHRDAHPGNIMLRNNGKAVLIDFGIAKDTPPSSFSKDFGNRAYVAYEQRSSNHPRLDVYSLAASLYYAVTGQRPITALSRRLDSAELLPPQRYNPTISDQLNQAIVKGMALEATDRPQSVQQWLELLTPRDARNSEETRFLKVFQFNVVTVNAQGEKVNRRLQQAKFFTENLGNDAILEMVSIPGGTFLMGSPVGEGDNDEKPQHSVTVAPFYIGKYPVTQKQWQAVMDSNPSHYQGENRPVENVSWHDAVEFCSQLSQKTGNFYRLPSEAEWEYACRAGTNTPFHFGETITADLANYDARKTYASAPKGTYRQETTPVGSFLPNAFGLYDMHGNVWEWCADPWHDNYNGAPSDASVWEYGGNNQCRVQRGGSWGRSAVDCRSAFRRWDSPGFRFRYFGFRLVLVSRS